jgi:hypothetical protein
MEDEDGEEQAEEESLMLLNNVKEYTYRKIKKIENCLSFTPSIFLIGHY